MKSIQLTLASALLVFLGLAATSQAEDIDIYSGSTMNGAPNVMIIIDNASNSNAQMTACTYWDGTIPTGTNQGTKSLDNYMCALDNIAHSMPAKADGTAFVNLGITTQAGVFLGLTPVDDQPYTGSYVHGLSGSPTNREVLSTAIRALTDTTGSATQGASFQETWAYYTGGNGGSTNVGLNSGTSYSGTNATSGCQKNYVIFVSGVTNSAHANTLGGELTQLTAAINNAVAAGGLTAAQKTALLTTVPTGESPYGVEWARFMKTLDINTTTAGTGTQSIITYSVAAGEPVYPAAMGSMEKYIYSTSKYGGGKYFAAKSYADITQSILKILSEVQAVNSVFTSSSLPVSVNAQGTYLNQIYMGMFRPDPSSNPRWMGNLKQYHFVATRDATTHKISLSLSDSLDASAINPATGFITPDAVSYWTCGGSPSVRACSPVSDVTGGFWKNDTSKIDSVGGAYDLPDGEWVDKGGAAQIVRLANLTNDYTAAAESSANPRKLYTYCPSGVGCEADLTHVNNRFSTDNGGILAGMFGAATTVKVSSIVRTDTTAVVTTVIPHGFTNGKTVIINGAAESAYNVTQAITGASGSVFTISGLPNNPPTSTTGTYAAALHNSAGQAIISMTVATSTTANANSCTSGTIPNINCNQVTVNLPGHGYASGDTVVIGGVSPAAYNGAFIIGNVSTDSFTYNVSVTPSTPSKNAYTIAPPPPAAKVVTSIAKATGKCTVTANAHGYANGASVTVTGNSLWNGDYTISGVATNTFVIPITCNDPGTGGLVVLNTPSVAIAAGNITRASATASTATGIAASALNHNQTYTLAYASGSNSNEAAYAPYLSGSRNVVISCASGTSCTTFTFPIASSPSTTLTLTSATASLSDKPVEILPGQITRVGMGTTATVTGVLAATPTPFVTGDKIDLSATGAVVGSESAYLSPPGGWTITCTAVDCTSFTFGPVQLDAPTPATGAFITAYQGSTPPTKDNLMNWVRGHDNFGDELGPGGSVTIRPSLHGDVLHSRPITVNYGGSIGVVVFYGANDGVFRAINGNQTASIGSVPPGGELWGYIPSDLFSNLTRQRDNSPLLDLPSTAPGIVPTPKKKDYFVDGSTGIYQLLNADGSANKVYLYLSLRRGGNSVTAVNVTDPSSPQFMWKINNTGEGNFAELGQTWSAPKAAMIKGYNDGSGNAKPVVIFGAGYATTQDSEPAGIDSAGRGIYIVDAVTGDLVWRATVDPLDSTLSACSAVGVVPATCTVAGMNYSIPADITLMDSDGDGYIDRLYAVDMGGNVWRVDLQREGNLINNTPDYWRVNKVASLGGFGSPLRKFFYPPDVVSTSTFDAVIVGSGDREHPLYTNAAFDKQNRIFMLKDISGNDGSSLTTIVKANLFDATSATYTAAAASFDGSTTPNKGYFIDLRDGEKVVNTPLTVAGYTYLGTNQPTASNTCSANLGIARGYRLSPLDGTYTSTEFAGGGLPPSPVAGVVSITVAGESTPSLVPFVIGAGGNPNCVGADCSSALGGADATVKPPPKRSRTYWYQEMD